MSNKWYQIKARILDSRWLSKFIRWTQRVTLPGFIGIPIYDISTFIYSELKKDDIVTRANSVAFSFFLSLFPFIIFVLPLLSLTSWSQLWLGELEESMGDVFPDDAKSYFLDVVDGIRGTGAAGLQSIGFIFAAIFASSGMLTLMYGFDKSYSLSFKSRSYFKKRLVALNLTFLLVVIVLVSMALIILGKYVLTFLTETFEISMIQSLAFVILKWLIIIMLFYSVLTVIYRYGPSTYRPLKLINPGASLATLCTLAASLGFSYFINNFNRYNEIYGSIGALIVILLWLQINSFIILAGFELNASIIVNRDSQLLTDQEKKTRILLK